MRRHLLRGGLAALAIVSVLGSTLPAAACDGPMMRYQNSTDAGTGTDATGAGAGLPAAAGVANQAADGQAAPALPQTTRAVGQGWFVRWIASAEGGLGTLAQWLHSFEALRPTVRL